MDFFESVGLALPPPSSPSFTGPEAGQVGNRILRRMLRCFLRRLQFWSILGFKSPTLQTSVSKVLEPSVRGPGPELCSRPFSGWVPEHVGPFWRSGGHTMVAELDCGLEASEARHVTGTFLRVAYMLVLLAE